MEKAALLIMTSDGDLFVFLFIGLVYVLNMLGDEGAIGCEKTLEALASASILSCLLWSNLTSLCAGPKPKLPSLLNWGCFSEASLSSYNSL